MSYVMCCARKLAWSVLSIQADVLRVVAGEGLPIFVKDVRLGADASRDDTLFSNFEASNICAREPRQAGPGGVQHPHGRRAYCS